MTTTSGQVPHKETQRQTVPACATAVSAETTIGEAPYAGVISGVSYTPATAITGADDDTRLVQLVNKGQAGTGTTVVASLQFDDGVDATADNEVALTLSEVDDATVVAAGDILAWQSNAVGDGLADPGGLAAVEANRD